MTAVTPTHDLSAADIFVQIVTELASVDENGLDILLEGIQKESSHGNVVLAFQAVKPENLTGLIINDVQTCIRGFYNFSKCTKSIQLVAECLKDDSLRVKFTSSNLVETLLDIIKHSDEKVLLKKPGIVIQCCRALGNLCFDNEIARTYVLSFGGLSSLVSLVRMLYRVCKSQDVPIDGPGGSLPTVIMGCLLNLTDSDSCQEALLTDFGEEFLPLLIQLIQCLPGQSGCHAVNLMCNLSYTTSWHSLLIGNAPGIIKLFEKFVNENCGRINGSTSDSTVLDALVEIMRNIFEHSTDTEKCYLIACDVWWNLVKVAEWCVSREFSDTVSKLPLISSPTVYCLKLVSKEKAALLKSIASLMITLLADDMCMHRIYRNGHSQEYSVIRSWLSSPNLELRTYGVYAIGNFARSDDTCIRLVEDGVGEILIVMLESCQENVCNSFRNGNGVNSIVDICYNKQDQQDANDSSSSTPCLVLDENPASPEGFAEVTIEKADLSSRCTNGFKQKAINKDLTTCLTGQEDCSLRNNAAYTQEATTLNEVCSVDVSHVDCSEILQTAVLSALRNLLIPKKNKVKLCQAGLLQRLISLLPVRSLLATFKYLGCIRMMVDSQPDVVLEVAASVELVRAIVDWSRMIERDASNVSCLNGSSDVIQSEAQRVLCWLVKSNFSAEVRSALATAGAVPVIVNMLRSEHVLMQNEALIALSLFTNGSPPDEVFSALINCGDTLLTNIFHILQSSLHAEIAQTSDRSFSLIKKDDVVSKSGATHQLQINTSSSCEQKQNADETTSQHSHSVLNGAKEPYLNYEFIANVVTLTTSVIVLVRKHLERGPPMQSAARLFFDKFCARLRETLLQLSQTDQYGPELNYRFYKAFELLSDKNGNDRGT